MKYDLFGWVTLFLCFQISLCSDALPLFRQANGALRSLRCHELLIRALYALHEINRDLPYTPLLRFIEVSLTETDCISKGFCTIYYEAILSLFINNFGLPERKFFS